MRRILIAIFIAFGAAAFVFLMVLGILNPSNAFLPLGAGMVAALIALPAVLSFLPQSEEHQKAAAIPDEKTYLNGRLREFGKEREYFVALSGDTVIESRFDAYDEAFTADQPGQRIHEYRNIADAVKDHKQFVIVGEPGAGKSTTLRTIAEAVVRARIDRSIIRDSWLAGLYGAEGVPLPLWISLGDSNNPSDADQLLRYWWERYNLPNTPEIALNNQDIWLFMDGLDEMPEAGADRESRAKAIRVFLEKHSNIRTIITCRVREYDEKLNLGVPVVKVKPLDEARIAEFADKRVHDQVFLDQLKAHEALQSIARNPYTLAMLTDIYREKKQIPTGLNDLYRLYTDLRHTEYFKAGKVKLPWDQLKRKLEKLGFQMMNAQKGTACDTRWAKRQIGKQALNDGVGMGVLVEENDVVRFYHQRLHGYFALPGLTKEFQLQTRDVLRIFGAVVLVVLMVVSAWVRGKIGHQTNTTADSPDIFSYTTQRLLERRSRFIVKIGELGDQAEPALDLLISALRDKDTKVQMAAFYALNKMGASAAPAIPVLVEIMGGDQSWGYEAASTLGRIGAVSAVPALVEALQAKDNTLLVTAAGMALERIGTPEALEAAQKWREQQKAKKHKGVSSS